MKTFKRIRDAVTGKFVTRAEARERPAETVAETVAIPTRPAPLAYGVPEIIIRNTIWRETGDDGKSHQIAKAIMVELARNGHTFR